MRSSCLLVLALLGLASLAGCAADSGLDEPAVATGQADEALTAKKTCPTKKSETSCLAKSGCAWGDQGSGLECFYVGKIVAQPGASAPAPAPAPAACTTNHNVTSCLAESGCAWGDEGSGDACFYVGVIVAQ